MPKVVVRGESVYQCTVCNRKLRVPTNRVGLDVLHYCTITAGCKGKLNRLVLNKDIINTPTLTPTVAGLEDWFKRPLLYDHSQVVAADNWIVTHNLQSKPIIHTFLNRIVDGVTQLVSVPQPITETIDANNTKLIFSQPETGLAQFISLASQNTTNPAIYVTTAPVTEKIQVSTNTGLITIATVNSDTVVDISITFIVTGQSPITILYTDIDNIPTASSPWAGVRQVYLNGTTYYVRSIDIINNPNAISAFLSGQIPTQGGSFYLSDTNYITHTPGSVLILGAVAPFNSVDRIYDQYVDFSSETALSAGVLYSFGKVYATSTVIKSVYPYISVV